MSDVSELNDDGRPSYEYEVGRFPDRLRKAIGSRSVRSFAAECGLSDTVLRQYLSGKSEPSRIALIAIAREAQVRIEWLISGSGKMNLAPTPPQMTAAHNELRDRIRLRQLSPAALVHGNPVGLTIDLLSKYLNGKGILSDEQLSWLAKKVGFPHVDDLFIEPQEVATEAHHEQAGAWHQLSDISLEPKVEARRGDDRYCYIPLYNVQASAGGGAVVDTETVVDFLSFKAEWIRTQLNASPADLYLIHVEGESMEPTLRPGDVILVDHRQAAALPSDGVYVLRMDDTLLVKRLQRLPGAQVRVTSDNAAYQPFTVSLAQERNEMEIVGRVVWCGRRM
jgi:phage repressor protein C with HTH and peptisase S24 domain/transcriptional regulator with XRE-family HTH domain